MNYYEKQTIYRRDVACRVSTGEIENRKKKRIINKQIN